MSTERILPVAVLAAAVLALTACGSTEEAGPVAATTSVVSTAPEAADEVPTDTTESSATASAGAKLTVTDIRVGRHDGFDRVVYELDGEGSPGWRVGYVDAADQDGRGRVLPVSGAGVLEVRIDGSAYPFDTGIEPFAGPAPVPGVPDGAVVEVTDALVFEGVAQSFVGVSSGDRPFAVTALSDPARVVVDVAH